MPCQCPNFGQISTPASPKCQGSMADRPTPLSSTFPFCDCGFFDSSGWASSTWAGQTGLKKKEHRTRNQQLGAAGVAPWCSCYCRVIAAARHSTRFAKLPSGDCALAGLVQPLLEHATNLGLAESSTSTSFGAPEIQPGHDRPGLIQSLGPPWPLHAPGRPQTACLSDLSVTRLGMAC